MKKSYALICNRDFIYLFVINFTGTKNDIIIYDRNLRFEIFNKLLNILEDAQKLLRNKK